ncbi:hypothetical protein PSTT_14632 [Puccinia striiformis]|uniref:Uncharacterized protein n=1 Tax=Puccinia striiformis TaxID=27350 RepID=A0A2S4UL97_9BASI|nr:hypothetical protein PSTT_14632 [Puccinia striiformis]
MVIQAGGADMTSSCDARGAGEMQSHMQALPESTHVSRRSSVLQWLMVKRITVGQAQSASTSDIHDRLLIAFAATRISEQPIRPPGPNQAGIYQCQWCRHQLRTCATPNSNLYQHRDGSFRHGIVCRHCSGQLWAIAGGCNLPSAVVPNDDE